MRRGVEWEAFLLGIACGAVGGLLLAPLAGSEMRRRVASGAKEPFRLGRSAMDRSREARELAEEAANLIKRAKALQRPL